MTTNSILHIPSTCDLIVQRDCPLKQKLDEPVFRDEVKGVSESPGSTLAKIEHDGSCLESAGENEWSSNRIRALVNIKPCMLKCPKYAPYVRCIVHKGHSAKYTMYRTYEILGI